MWYLWWTKWHWGQTFLWVLRFSSVSMLFHTKSTFTLAFDSRKLEKLENLPKTYAIPVVAEHQERKADPVFVVFKVLEICCLAWRKYISFCFPVAFVRLGHGYTRYQSWISVVAIVTKLLAGRSGDRISLYLYTFVSCTTNFLTFLPLYSLHN